MLDMTKKASPKTTSITKDQVAHVAHLAHMPLTDDQVSRLTPEFAETLAVITNLKQVDVSKVEPTHQVTGLENVWREDVVIPEYSFSQAEALANAPAKHNGFFVVPQVIDQGD